MLCLILLISLQARGLVIGMYFVGSTDGCISAWGFLSSKEVKDAGVGNLGLEDR
jgi:hypothetical protein